MSNTTINGFFRKPKSTYLLVGMLMIVLIVSSGCQVIPTDMFPRVTWYWSKDAKQYRADKKADNPYKHQ